MQKPPVFSSIHINGEWAYKKARRGEKFEIPSKKVIIYELNLLNWNELTGKLDLYIRCSQGTYIRSLAWDLGETIGCGGVLAKLRRVESLGFNEKQAIKIKELKGNEILKEKSIINPIHSLNHLPTIELITDTSNDYWQHGRKIDIKDLVYKEACIINKEDINNSKQFISVLNQSKCIVGIAELVDKFSIKPKVVFNAKG